MDEGKYYELKGFQNVYLEDSYVLNIQESQTEIVFILDVVLTEQHPLYTAPAKDEQYCYRRASIVFPQIKDAVWEERSMQRFVDASGEYDYGNIDDFQIENEYYYLSGDWGSIKIISANPELRIHE